MCSKMKYGSLKDLGHIKDENRNELLIIYRDMCVIFVDKPYDMYINSNDLNEKNTVAYHLALSDSHKSTSSERLYFVHRLDYATSGLLCVAKDKHTAGQLGTLFQKRQVRKYYLAVVRGHLNIDAADILYDVGELSSTSQTNHKMIAIKSIEDEEQCSYTRKAETKLLVLERGYYDGEPATVLLLQPKTGRRHQLRVHCDSIGHTIVGDYTYSDGADQGPHRMFLHARGLEISKLNINLCTQHPYAKDEQFVAKWKCDGLIHRHEDISDFMVACDYIDGLNVHIKYKR